MMNTTLTRWDSKTYKWSVVVRQEPEAGDVLEVCVQYCAKLPENNPLVTPKTIYSQCSLSRWRVTSALALFKWWRTVCLLFLLTLCINCDNKPDTNCRIQTYQTQSKESKIVDCNKSKTNMVPRDGSRHQIGWIFENVPKGGLGNFQSKKISCWFWTFIL